MFVAFPALVLFLILQLTLLTLIPQRIVVRRDKVIIEHSQKRVIETSSISKAWLVINSSDRIRLKLCYELDGRRKNLTVGVAAAVDLAELKRCFRWRQPFAMHEIDAFTRHSPHNNRMKRSRNRPTGLLASQLTARLS